MAIIREHDRYYTRADTARFCVDVTLKYLEQAQVDPSSTLFLEPSAGAGAFLDLLPAARRMGLDLAPAHPEIVQQDFLSFELVRGLSRLSVQNDEGQTQSENLSDKQTIVVVGNPPFGRNSSLAVKFVNKAATLADVVAFILPKTFQKASTVRRLDPRLHLAAEFEIPTYSFILEGANVDVPCVFQIWIRRPEPRPDVPGPRTHPDFRFVKREHADFAVRRVGRSAGQVIEDFAAYARTSHHFIKASNPQDVMRKLRNINWSVVRSQTAGVPCVGKEELIRLYSQASGV